jgi:alpha-N-arabinofuranosidase
MNKEHQDAESLPLRLTAPAPVRQVADTTLETVTATASRKHDQVLISLTNLHADDPVTVELDLRGAHLGEPTGTVLTAGTLNAHNTPADPDAVRPRPLPGVTLDGTIVRVPLPPHAFATVSLPVHPPR